MDTNIGKLFIVPTPIGNLADITQRAVDTLSAVDIIAAEDTRHSGKLLQHLGIKTRTIALHDHNEKARAKQLIDRISQGESIALISDAGTPLISDPGYSLVSSCRAQGIIVVALPGACAAITALSASGMPTDKFLFAGFVPVKQVAKQATIDGLLNETATSVFYESPRRVRSTVEMVVERLGEEREIVVARELTKTFEQYFAGCASAALTWLDEDLNHQRGEFVLIIRGVVVDKSDVPLEAIKLLKLLTAELPLKKAAAIVAAHYQLKKNTLYQLGLDLND